jgi:hypothetical protein
MFDTITHFQQLDIASGYSTAFSTCVGANSCGNYGCALRPVGFLLMMMPFNYITLRDFQVCRGITKWRSKKYHLAEQLTP